MRKLPMTVLRCNNAQPHECKEPERRVSVSQIASLFGLPKQTLSDPVKGHCSPTRQEFLSMSELASRWRCSRGTVYNRLRAARAEVLDFAPPGKRGKKVVRITTVTEIENR